jgi:hypothetical protein
VKSKGVTMQRPHLFLSILILALFLAGCAPKEAAQPPEVRALEDPTPTDLPEESALIQTATPEIVPDEPPASCPITQAPEVAFVPPAPFPPEPPERYVNEFWYGTPELWTMLGTEATWSDLPHNKHGYSQKIFWWSQHFDVTTDPYPELTVSIEQLDTDTPSSPVVIAEQATNASADFGTAMLTGVDLPTLGCWKITGQYQQAELSFVVWVAP